MLRLAARTAAEGAAVVCAWAGVGLIVAAAVLGKFAYGDN